MKIAIINKIKPKIIDNLNISVVFPTFFKSIKEIDRAYSVNIAKGMANNPNQMLNKP